MDEPTPHIFALPEGVFSTDREIVYADLPTHFHPRFCPEFMSGRIDLILLVTDSTYESSLWTKQQITSLRTEFPGVSLLAIANKQDLPQSIPSQRVEEILGVHTVGLVAIDPGSATENRIRLTEEIGQLLGLPLGPFGRSGEWPSSGSSRWLNS
jgi:signal recognition particle receptor subunit beta